MNRTAALWRGYQQMTTSPAPWTHRDGENPIRDANGAVVSFTQHAARIVAAVNAHEAGWQPIESAPKDVSVLLWWVGANVEKKAPASTTIGAVSSHETDSVWTGGDYRPLSWFTHWQPLPAAPVQP